MKGPLLAAVLLPCMVCTPCAVRACDPPQTPSTARTQAAAWTDVSARIAKADAQIFFQLRITSGGELALRSLDSGRKEWVERLRTKLGTEPRRQMDALRSLHKALVTALPAKGERADDGSGTKALLVLDVEASTPWRWVQWAVLAAASPKIEIWRLCFVGTAPGVTLDVDLPRDAGMHAAPARAEPEGIALSVLMSRKEREQPREAFTRIQITSSPATIVRGILQPMEERVGAGDLTLENKPTSTSSAPRPTEPQAVDLPVTGAGEEAHAKKWAEVESKLRAEAKQYKLLVGMIRTAPPDGPFTPYADVYAAMSLLRKVGASALQFDATAAPLSSSEGGGWDFR